ncbi:sodium/potassium/calcium exchanger 1-like [Eleutherodactylus coqui]|uniref:sodium/potassium/calcium exchanger 1-like n=1 Tax=Eleutherodactylus coqui TaxID=57060 RepID=UPI003462A1C1
MVDEGDAITGLALLQYDVVSDHQGNVCSKWNEEHGSEETPQCEPTQEGQDLLRDNQTEWNEEHGSEETPQCEPTQEGQDLLRDNQTEWNEEHGSEETPQCEPTQEGQDLLRDNQTEWNEEHGSEETPQCETSQEGQDLLRDNQTGPQGELLYNSVSAWVYERSLLSHHPDQLLPGDLPFPVQETSPDSRVLPAILSQAEHHVSHQHSGRRSSNRTPGNSQDV